MPNPVTCQDSRTIYKQCVAEYFNCIYPPRRQGPLQDSNPETAFINFVYFVKKHIPLSKVREMGKDNFDKKIDEMVQQPWFDTLREDFEQYKKFENLFREMDGASFCLGLPPVRFRYNGISIDSTVERDNFWKFISGSEARAREILYPQLQEALANVFNLETPASQADARETRKKEKETSNKVKLRLTTDTFDVTWEGKPVSPKLPETSYKFLYALAKRADTSVKREIFEEMLTGVYDQEKRVSKHMNILRKRMPEGWRDKKEGYIETCHGVGYRLKLSKEEVEVEGGIKDVDRELM